MMSRMTAAEFERAYADRSSLTVATLRQLGRVVVPCECGEEGCDGWASVSRDSARATEEVKELVKGAPQRHFDRQSKNDHPDYPYICRECRGVVFGSRLAHQCEQWRCPQCLGVLSRQGFCPYCGDRFEFPKKDLVQELAELKAWIEESVIEVVEGDAA